MKDLTLPRKLIVLFILPCSILLLVAFLVSLWAIWSMAAIPGEKFVFPWITLCLFILLLLGSLSWLWYLPVYLSRKVCKPLKAIREAADLLGKGQPGGVLPFSGKDEMALLTGTFNTMVRRIDEKITELLKERSGRMRSVIDGEEMERQRLSRELHDGIGQLLIAIKLRLESLLYLEEKEIKNSIREMKNYFDQIIDEVRRISNNLMPSVLEAFSIPIAFRNLFAETEEHTGLNIRFEAKGNFDDLDKKAKTYIYRLTQEALSNIVKHADAHNVEVRLSRDHESLSLMIRDDGKGFSVEKAGTEKGNGIHNMRERASLMQGVIDIRSAQGKGTTIMINVPVIHLTYAENQDFPRG